MPAAPPPLRSPFRLRARLWVPSMVLLVSAACGGDRSTPAGPAQSAAEPSDLVAASLRPPILIEGEEPVVWTLAERMAHHEVPAVAVAVLEDGRLAWQRAWGVADAETGREATPRTLFQAASISKPVAALAALSLVADGVLALDEPIDDRLRSWTLPRGDVRSGEPVTLRRLLTHSAGTTVWGFPGYRKDVPFDGERAIPTNVEVLDGEGNTDPVTLFQAPGTGWQYSGGGYTVMEQLVEDVTGRPFEEVARERVLGPAGMTLSTFEQPLPEARWSEAARGHGGDGAEVEGEWHSYPEQAAAGLWTTPGELVALSVHLLGILDGEVEDGVLPRELLEEMLTPNRPDEEAFRNWGLGFGLDGAGEEAVFRHGGANAGFRSSWVTARNGRWGVAVMTNGDRGSALAAEIVRAVATVEDWPTLQPETRASRRLSAEEAQAYAGRYALEARPEFVIAISPGDVGLGVEIPDQADAELRAGTEPDAFFDPVDGTTMIFLRNGDGTVVGAETGNGQRWNRVGPVDVEAAEDGSSSSD